MTFVELCEKFFIPLGATFTGAYLAFKYQHAIEKNRDKRAVVQNLMMYRNVLGDELDFIKSINAADLVFHDCEIVRRLLEKYFKATEVPEMVSKGIHVDIFYELLYHMAQDAGYTQLTKSDVRNFYYPVALQQHYPQQFSGAINNHSQISANPY